MSNLSDIYIKMSSCDRKEISADCHLIAFRYILLQYRVVLNSLRYKIITAGNHFTVTDEGNVHDDCVINFLKRNFQFSAFFRHKVTADCHLVAFRYILLKDGIVLYAFRNEEISSGDKLVIIHEANVHDNIFVNLLKRNFQFSAFFRHKVTADCHLVAFRYILLKDRIVLYAFR